MSYTVKLLPKAYQDLRKAKKWYNDQTIQWKKKRNGLLYLEFYILVVILKTSENEKDKCLYPDEYPDSPISYINANNAR